MSAESLTIPPGAVRLLRHSAERLATRFADSFSPETVAACLDDSYIVLAATAKVRDHLYVLAERFAAERLAAIRSARRDRTGVATEVLFVCVHNAGRSQMAAALLAHHAGDRVVVRSVGSAPVDQVNPAVVAAMEEIGLDLSREFPKPFTDETVRASDVVITMGCGDACPIYPGKRYLNWELDDPADQPVETVRAIRDDLDTRVRLLLRELSTQE